LFAALLLAAAATVAPFPDLALAGLENRFPRPFVTTYGDIAGVILLNGEQPSVAEAARLARASGSAKVLYSTGGGPAEGNAVLASLVRHGVPKHRVLTKTFSRNTADDAASAYHLLQPQPPGQWVLVTAAFHMPRAVAAFRTAGFTVIAHPVLRFADPDRPFSLDLVTGPSKLRRTLRECVGLIAYFLLGYSMEVFPDHGTGGKMCEGCQRTSDSGLGTA